MFTRTDGVASQPLTLPTYLATEPTTATTATTPARTGPVDLGYSPYGFVPAAAGTDTGFAEAARGKEPQWELDTDLALISQDVYNTDGASDIGSAGWSRVSDEDLLAAGIDPATLDTPDTGFRAGVYTDGEGRYVVAFAGSREGADWIQNLKQGVGLPAEQYEQAMALAQQTVQAFGTGNVVFTGHSLGGGLASTAALAVDDSTAVTFNAAGVSPATMMRLGLNPLNKDVADDRIRRYNVENEVLTGMQEDSYLSGVLPDAVGYEITLENPGGAFENPLTSHGMDAVLPALASRDVKNTEGDNFLETALEENTWLLGGHSVNDALQTGGDVVDSVVETGQELYNDWKDSNWNPGNWSWP